MYFYIISGYIAERSLTVSTVAGEDGNMVEVYTPVTTQVPIRQRVSYAEMLEAYEDETDCYISYDDEDPPGENETVEHLSEEGALITAELLEDLEEIFGSDIGSDSDYGGESVVGSGSGGSYSQDGSGGSYSQDGSGGSYSQDGSGAPITHIGSMYLYTTYTHSIPFVGAGASHTATVTLEESGYELIGISGFAINDSTDLIPFRVRVDSGDLVIGIRNMASDAVINKTMAVDLIWKAVRDLNVEEEGDNLDEIEEE